MVRESQYTDGYLAATTVKRITIGSYLERHLRGRAGSYRGRYREALRRSVLRRGAVAVKSVGGRTAYVLQEEGNE